MKALLLIDQLGAIGGSEVSTVLLAAALADGGNEVVVAAPCGSARMCYTHVLNAHGVALAHELVDLPGRLDGKDTDAALWHSAYIQNVKDFVATLDGIIDRFHPDIVHANGVSRGLIEWLRYGRAREATPVVAQVDVPVKPPWVHTECVTFESLAEIDALIASCTECAEVLRERFDGPIHVIPNITSLHPVSRPLPRGSISLGCVSRLAPMKGVEFAISAIAALRDDGVAATLSIYGDGPDVDRLRDLRDALGLSGRVSFDGVVEPFCGITKLIERHHIFLAPSLGESFGMTMVEMLAYGRPTICSRVGIGKDISFSPLGECVVQPGRSDLIAAAVSVLACERARLERLSTAAHAWWVDRFSTKAVLPQVLNLYAQTAEASSTFRIHPQGLYQ